ncbi:MAG: ABC transporter permease [Bacteroidetes bacterium]|nr:ABC transporter permease [Bacteroidota bacterium]
MLKILKYSFYDLVRSRWSLIYFAFYITLGFVLLFLNNDISKSVITLMNIIIVLTPLIATLLGIMYYYNSREFIELLLAHPMKRSAIFIGQYLGLSISLSISLILGLGIPFLIYGVLISTVIFDFLTLILVGTFLNFIFVALAYNIALSNENKIKGFGYAILLWLFLAVIYDGLLLTLLVVFDDYPLEKTALMGSVLNPIDLSRILILLKLDISALMGYTGAIFKNFFGNSMGMLMAFAILLVWVVLPVGRIVQIAKRKDF